MSDEHPPAITIALSAAQVDEVVRACTHARTPTITTLARNGHLLADTDDPRLSRSLVRGLSLLTCFGAEGRARGIVELANSLGMSASTAHRYASTLVELGMLERCPKTRKYRPAGVAGSAPRPRTNRQRPRA